MKVKLRNPDRIVDVSGPRVVSALLKELDIVPGTKHQMYFGFLKKARQRPAKKRSG